MTVKGQLGVAEVKGLRLSIFNYQLSIKKRV